MAGAELPVRGVESADLNPLAQLWFDGWQDAHAAILPEKLARHRTLDSFRERLAAHPERLRVIGEVGAPLAFAKIDGDELNQFYVAAGARGTGVAARLVADAEAVIAAKGRRIAWLACAIGNDRAARFYEKQGWRRRGVMTSTLDVPGGVVELDVWRYEKAL